MGIREKLSDNPRVATVMAAAIVAIGAAVLYLQWPRSSDGFGPPAKMFLTIDDGKTFFVAPAEPLPPFQHEGKTAYRAFVFTCDGGRTKWVGYLERYSDRAKTLMAGMWKKQAATGGPPPVPEGMLQGIEVAKPGELQWVRQSDTARALPIINVHCPDAPGRDAEMVFP
jgi:hypothetical protein